MPGERTERRLAAILAADVVGYSRLMEADEAGTLKRLKAARKEVFDPTIKRYGGRIVKTTGDGMLCEFPSAVDAVQCAVAVQEEMAARGAGEPGDKRLQFRVGVNLGDIIIDDDDIFGEGVNIAARLEGLAEPGGILISATVHEQTVGKIDSTFADSGEQSLKNIAKPVRVFGWEGEAGAESSSKPRNTALALPDKPSIAVLPFENMSGDPDQDYFADGTVEDIITALSRVEWLFVIARNSSFTYKGQAVDVKQVARELGVRYVLEGSVRKAGDRVRITAQLIDAETGGHIWAERFDGALDDVFDLQDEITSRVAGAIEPKLRQAEIERARVKPTNDLNAYDLYLRAVSHFYGLSAEDNAQAIEYLGRAVAIDPRFAAANGLLAWSLVQRRINGWGGGPDDVAWALDLARSVIESDRADAMALAYAGHTYTMFAHDFEQAMRAFDRSIAANPNLPLALALSGYSLIATGRAEEALTRVQKAERLSPQDPFAYVFGTLRATAAFYLGRLDDAADAARDAVSQRSGFIISRLILVAALGAGGKVEEARTAVADLLRSHPNMTISFVRANLPLGPMEQTDQIFEALKVAGMPEGG